MVNLRRIFKDYRDAGSLNALIALWGFIDDHTFLDEDRRAGRRRIRLTGVDDECLDHADRRAVVHRLRAGLPPTRRIASASTST